jgi:hypothetical protein
MMPLSLLYKEKKYILSQTIHICFISITICEFGSFVTKQVYLAPGLEGRINSIAQALLKDPWLLLHQGDKHP